MTTLYLLFKNIINHKLREVGQPTQQAPCLPAARSILGQPPPAAALGCRRPPRVPPPGPRSRLLRCFSPPPAPSRSCAAGPSPQAAVTPTGRRRPSAARPDFGPGWHFPPRRAPTQVRQQPESGGRRDSAAGGRAGGDRAGRGPGGPSPEKVTETLRAPRPASDPDGGGGVAGRRGAGPRAGAGAGAGGRGRRVLPFRLLGELRLFRALARSSSIAAAISGLSSPLYQTRSSSPGAIGCGERRDKRRANQSGGCWRGRGGAQAGESGAPMANSCRAGAAPRPARRGGGAQTERTEAPPLGGALGRAHGGEAPLGEGLSATRTGERRAARPGGGAHGRPRAAGGPGAADGTWPAGASSSPCSEPRATHAKEKTQYGTILRNHSAHEIGVDENLKHS